MTIYRCGHCAYPIDPDSRKDDCPRCSNALIWGAYGTRGNPNIKYVTACVTAKGCAVECDHDGESVFRQDRANRESTLASRAGDNGPGDVASGPSTDQEPSDAVSEIHRRVFE